MDYLFEIRDRTGRQIRLPTERWKHIIQEHPHLQNVEEIREALTNPLKITSSKNDPEWVRYYFRYNKNTKRYLMVAVKYLNGDGFIITAFYRRTIP